MHGRAHKAAMGLCFLGVIPVWGVFAGDAPTLYRYAISVTFSAPVEHRTLKEKVEDVISNRLCHLAVAHDIRWTQDGTGTVDVAAEPQVSEPRIRALLTAPGYLELRMLHPRDESLTSTLLATGWLPHGYEIDSVQRKGNGGQLLRRVGGAVSVRVTPPNFTGMEDLGPEYELMLMEEKVHNEVLYSMHFVRRVRLLSGDKIKVAEVISGGDHLVIRATLDDAGKRKIEKLLAPSENKAERILQVGIVIDGILCSLFRLDPERTSQFDISRPFLAPEAQDLCAIINSGPLPCPIRAQLPR